MSRGGAASVAIAGGGVFGAAAALELARSGRTVTLVDPGPLPTPDASSTDTSKAVRADYGDDDHHTALAREAIEGWNRWNRDWDFRPFQPCGFLFATFDPIVPGGFEALSLERHRAAGAWPERFDAASLVSRFPPLAGSAFQDGYLSPGAGFVESGRAVAELFRQARAAGADVREGARVLGLLERGRAVEGVVLQDGTTVRAGTTVVAAGAWTPTLVPELTDRMVATGQTVLYLRPERPERFSPGAFPVWSGDITRTGWYGFPATPEGRVKIGHHGPGRPADPTASRAADPAVEARARAFLARAIPELAAAPLASDRECLYADVWDGAFVIDRHPERPGLAVAAGGSGHGFKFAPVLGALIADAVDGGDDPRRAPYRWRARGATRIDPARAAGEPSS